MQASASSGAMERQGLQMTAASSASKSTRADRLGATMASSGPMTAVEGFRKMTGSSGMGSFISRMWSR